MWIALPNSFLSIVALQTALSGPRLLVRARAAGDIERIFPRATVTHTPTADYAYRTTLSRTVVTRGLTAAVRGGRRHPLNLVQKSIGHAQLSTTAIYAVSSAPKSRISPAECGDS